VQKELFSLTLPNMDEESVYVTDSVGLDPDSRTRRLLGRQIADRFVGHGVDTDLAVYAELLFPFDDPKWRIEAAKTMYSCALTGMSYLRHMGCEDKHLIIPYQKQPSQAVHDVWASDPGWVDATKPDCGLPGVGDLVLIDNAERKNPHVKIMRGWEGDEDALFEPSAGAVAETVDGGQPAPGGGYRILAKRCVFDRVSPTEILCRDATNRANFRQLVGYGPIWSYLLTTVAKLPQAAT